MKKEEQRKDVENNPNVKGDRRTLMINREV